MKILILLEGYLQNNKYLLSGRDKSMMATAMGIRNILQGTVTVLGCGSDLESVMKESLTLGADIALCLGAERFPVTTAEWVEFYTSGLGSMGYDIIISDHNGFNEKQLNFTQLMSQKLSLPLITAVRELEIDKGELRLMRHKARGEEVLTAKGKVWITWAGKQGQDIYPSIEEIQKIHGGEKTPKVLFAGKDFGWEPRENQGKERIGIELSKEEKELNKFQWIEGKDTQEKVEKLLFFLEKMGYIEGIDAQYSCKDSLPTGIELIGSKHRREYINLFNATFVLAGGRGLFREGKELLENCALGLGAVAGYTRPCVDDGWAELPQQIGKTGIIIEPELYIAFGISGAIQHMMGIKESACIIGINTDPQAEIFRYCKYGILSDAKEFLEVLQRCISVTQPHKTL